MTFYNNNTDLVLPLSKDGIYTTRQPLTKEEKKLFLGDYKLMSYITTTIQ